MLKEKLIQVFKILIPIGLGIYLVVHIYGQLDEEQRIALFEAFKRANYFWVALSFFMGLLSHYIRGFRWSYQLEAMGYHPRRANNFFSVMIGYVVNLALPRVGEVSRAAALTKYEKIPFQKSFGSILSERALDFIVLLFITATTIVLQYGILKPFAVEIYKNTLGKLDPILTGVVGVILIALLLAGLFALKRLSHIPIIEKISSFIHELTEGLRSILRMKKRVPYLLATLAIWLLYVGMFWICFLALEETAHLGISAIFAGFVLGSFAIVIIPGGIGAFPVGIMQSLALYGVAEENGFALGWIIWFSQTIMIVLVGGLSMLLMPIYNKDKIHVETGFS